MTYLNSKSKTFKECYCLGDIYRFPSLRLWIKPQTSLETVFLIVMLVTHTRRNAGISGLLRVEGV